MESFVLNDILSLKRERMAEIVNVVSDTSCSNQMSPRLRKHFKCFRNVYPSYLLFSGNVSPSNSDEGFLFCFDQERL